MTFKNQPAMTNNVESVIKRYSHQNLTLEHNGIHVKIQETGKVTISSKAEQNIEGEMEWDEVEVPASLIFKIARILQDTRRVDYVKVSNSEKKE